MFDRAAFMDTCAQRANLIEWLPFKEGQSVVIHQTAPEAVLEMLRARKVQLQVMSEVHIEKLAFNPGKGSLDCVVLLGMEVNAKMLAGLRRKLKPEGRLIVMLHNRYGMSYLAGKPADQTRDGQYYVAVEGKSENGTQGKSRFYSHQGVTGLLKEAGITSYTRYYLDPDDEFTVNIYSDAYLPKAGELSRHACNMTYDRLAVFDEVAASNQAAAEEMYPIFANEYLLVTGPVLPQVMVRYSNDRAWNCQIRTEICRGETGLEVRKIPLHPESAAHVQHMEETCKLLCQQYENSVFQIVPCSWNGEYAVFPFVKGTSLAAYMKKALQQGNVEAVAEMFGCFLDKLKQGKAGEQTNYDFVFHNILIQDDRWQVIDYEWTVDHFVSAEELAFRAAYCFSMEQKDFPFAEICKILEFDENKVQQLMAQEAAYQQRITGGEKSIESLWAEQGGDIFTRETLLRSLELSTEDNRVQIYEDSGKGFSEEQSYFVEHTLSHHDEMELELAVVADVKALRVDPCEEPCLVQIKKIWWNEEEQFLDKQLQLNGVKGKGGKNSYPEYVFATRDPNFTISLEKLTDHGKDWNTLRLQLEIHKISLQLANTLTKSIKRIL